ncbi:MAG: hypothetical protein ABIH23_04350, partial [bacterium]
VVDYDKIFADFMIPERIDYLSLDIEPNTNTFACLGKLLLLKNRFSVITFETDKYANDNGENSSCVVDESRSLLEQHQYKIVAGNISAFDDDLHPFEDWYLDGQYFDDKTIEKFKRDSDEPIAAFKYMLNV